MADFDAIRIILNPELACDGGILITARGNLYAMIWSISNTVSSPSPSISLPSNVPTHKFAVPSGMAYAIVNRLKIFLL